MQRIEEPNYKIALSSFTRNDNLPITPIDSQDPNRSGDLFFNQTLKHKRQIAALLVELRKQRQKNQQLKSHICNLAQETVMVMENDRLTLSKDLHDSVCGTLAAIKLHLEYRLEAAKAPPPEGVMSIERLIGHLAGAIKEARRIISHLQAKCLDDQNLTITLSKHIKQFNEFYPDIDVDFQFDLSEEVIPEDINVAVYRMAQEALNNIGKHSGAQKAKIRLTESNDRLLLEVKDNGRGFHVPDRASAPSLEGVGLRSMKERIEMCGGAFWIKAFPGRGTSLLAVLPLR